MVHLDPDAVALTGSMALQHELGRRGLARDRAGLADLDFVAKTSAAVAASVTTHFLVSHFHLPHPGYPKFMVQLVDPESRLPVDIFPGSPDVIDQASVSGICGRHVRVLRPDAILAHKLETLARASHERPVDEKHFRDARLLGPVCGRKVPDIPAACLCRTRIRRTPRPNVFAAAAVPAAHSPSRPNIESSRCSAMYDRLRGPERP